MRKTYFFLLLMLTTLFGALTATAQEKKLTVKSIVSANGSNPLLADSDNRISGLKYTLELQNAGTEDLNPGDEGYSLTLFQASNDLVTVPINVAIAAGSTATIDVTWDFSVEPLLASQSATTASMYTSLPVRENITKTTKYPTAVEIYFYRTAFELNSDNNTATLFSPISFGFCSTPTEKNYRIRNTGGKPLTIESIEVPEGFTCEYAELPVTLPSLVNRNDPAMFFPLSIKLTGTGITTGKVKFVANGVEKEYDIKGVLPGEGVYFEDFEGLPTGMPAGWIFESDFGVAGTPANYKTTANQYVLYMSNSSSSVVRRAITPKLHFNEGDKLYFQTYGRSGNANMNILWSPDRVNWQKVSDVKWYNKGGEFTFDTGYNNCIDVVLDKIPAGDGYIAFDCTYLYLDNVMGGTVVPVDFDLFMESYKMPTDLMAHNPYNAEIVVKNVNLAPLKASDYTVSLYAAKKPAAAVEPAEGEDGDQPAAQADEPAATEAPLEFEKVATVESVELAPGEVKTFKFDYIANYAGDYVFYAELAYGNEALSTPKTDVKIAVEVPVGEITWGNPSGYYDNTIPLTMNYCYSVSKIMYTEEQLAAFGINPGAVINGVKFKAYSSAKNYTSLKQYIGIKSWNDPLTTTNYPVFTEYNWAKDFGAVEFTSTNTTTAYFMIDADFTTPYVYTGGNIVMEVYSEGNTYVTWYFEKAKETGTAIYKRNDNQNTFNGLSFSPATQMPVTYFKVKAEPAVIAGTVTYNDEPVAGAHVWLEDGGVIYEGDSDEDGKYRFDVIQTGRKYTLQATAPGHPRYTAEELVDFTDGSLVADIAFRELPVFSGTVKDAAGNAVSRAQVALACGDVKQAIVADEEGNFSGTINNIDVKPYVIIVDDPDHKVYTGSIDFYNGLNKSLNIVLDNFTMNREFKLNVKVNDVRGQSLEGVAYTLKSVKNDVTYDEEQTQLDADGNNTINVWAGAHRITLAQPGMKTIVYGFNVNKDLDIELTLNEDVNTPYAVQAELKHDAFTGQNDIHMSWNSEAPAFFEDFENYDPFAIDFTPWTGLDLDKADAAYLQGSYPNAGKANYGQIINPKAVTPVWDLNENPTLAPYSGNQYLGFVQRADGNALNDWTITPQITVGEQNKLRFYVRCADDADAKLTVGITEAANPTADDFEIINDGNYITASNRSWMPVVIDLAEYVGKDVKIGFHCLSEQGTGMTMLDDVYVGRIDEQPASAARRVAARSAANPAEKFIITLNGKQVAETTDYEYTIENLPEGNFEVGVYSQYTAQQSAPVYMPIQINEEDYVAAKYYVTTNNDESVDGVQVSVANEEGTLLATVAEGVASIPYLPKGEYTVSVEAPFFQPYTKTVSYADKKALYITLEEVLTAPLNLTVESIHNEVEDTHAVTLNWNQDLGFAESFEAYDDFATGEFGGWTTVNNNQKASYPIALGSASNIVTFPGASTPANPASVAPMVFNPEATQPSMADDAAVKAADGVKSILFQGPQADVADKWLISPLVKINDRYEWTLAAKAYTFYPETLEFCISTSGNQPEDFTVLDAVNPAYTEWTQYALDLAAYEGQEVYLAVHCTSADGFICLVDDFKVGRVGGETALAVGKVQNYDIHLDDAVVANTQETTYTLPAVAPGAHTVGVKANYTSGASELTTYMLDLASGIDALEAAGTRGNVVNAAGVVIMRDASAADVKALPQGIYIFAGKKVVVK